ncbi:MAG: lipid-A-disaccharide synthase N-terminal domain-containing protein [Phycisphaerales bacterium]|nr:lipid-A-disaccharide synthase N-terminal domain-containing protein [Phycisphaerales bacterium]
MKPGPIIAMILLIFLGMWLVLQPALSRSHSDLTVRVGAHEIMLMRVQVDGQSAYQVLSPASLRTDAPIPPNQLDNFLAVQIDEWNARPAFERHLLGFFNITSWGTFGWVAIGLIGQCAFFGRMFVQWIISERTRVSTVPEIFWWFSFAGGLCLFIYFVWRVDIVGVLGQSTGIVIYARNLRLIHKEKQRCLSTPDTSADPEPTA